MQHIGGALEKLIKSNNLEKGLEEQKAVDIWEKVVGGRINENTEFILLVKILCIQNILICFKIWWKKSLKYIFHLEK